MSTSMDHHEGSKAHARDTPQASMKFSKRFLGGVAFVTQSGRGGPGRSQSSYSKTQPTKSRERLMRIRVGFADRQLRNAQASCT